MHEFLKIKIHIVIQYVVKQEVKRIWAFVFEIVIHLILLMNLFYWKMLAKNCLSSTTVLWNNLQAFSNPKVLDYLTIITVSIFRKEKIWSGTIRSESTTQCWKLIKNWKILWFYNQNSYLFSALKIHVDLNLTAVTEHWTTDYWLTTTCPTIIFPSFIPNLLGMS